MTGASRKALLLAALVAGSATMACSERGQGQTGFGGAATVATTSGPGGAGQGGAVATGVGGSVASGGNFGFSLVDRGLVVRYFLDEADSGTIDVDGEALDAAPDPLNLPMAGTALQAEYDVSDGHRGLRWTAQDSSGGPSIPIEGTKIFSRLHQASEATLEVVYDVEAVNGSGSRILHIGWDQQPGWLTLSTRGLTRMQMYVNGSTRVGNWEVPGNGRVVLHGVYDSNQADPADRARFYVDGTRVPRLSGSDVPEGLLVDLVVDPSEPLTLDVGHRVFGGRSIQGMVFYGAYYDVALTHHEIIQNASVLLESDDTPE